MSHLSKDELQALCHSVNERLAEFGSVFRPLSPGLVRLLYDHMMEWQRQGLTPHVITVESRPQLVSDGLRPASEGNERPVGSPMSGAPKAIRHRNGQPAHGMNITRYDIIAKLKEMAMGGTQMPTMAQGEIGRG